MLTPTRSCCWTKPTRAAEGPRSAGCYNLTVPRRLATSVFLALALAWIVPLWGQTYAASRERAAAQVQAAAAHLQQGNADQAIRECKSVLAADPRFAAAHHAARPGLSRARLDCHDRGSQSGAAAGARPRPRPVVGASFTSPRSTSTWAATTRPMNSWSAVSSSGPNVPHFLSPPGEVRRKMGDPTASLELNRKALQIDATMTPAHYYRALSGSEAGGRGHRRARKLHSIPVRRSGNVYCAGSLVRAKGSD
jgi:hypothetical protein